MRFVVGPDTPETYVQLDDSDVRNLFQNNKLYAEIMKEYGRSNRPIIIRFIDLVDLIERTEFIDLIERAERG